MSTQRSRLLSVTMKLDLQHSKNGWTISRETEMEVIIPGMEPTGHIGELGAYCRKGNEAGTCESASCQKSNELDDNNQVKMTVKIQKQ